MVMPVSGRISATYAGYCDGTPGDHQALDITNNSGAAVGAAAAGTVEIAGWSPSYGWMVHIRHQGDYLTRYLHMRSAPTVSVGQGVTQGQTIGYVGNTGSTSVGAHLHFAIWKGDATRWGPSTGYSCNQGVTKGTQIPIDFPGLGGGSAPTPMLTASAPYDFNRDGDSDFAQRSDGTITLYPTTGTADSQAPTHSWARASNRSSRPSRPPTSTATTNQI